MLKNLSKNDYVKESQYKWQMYNIIIYIIYTPKFESNLFIVF